MQKLNEIIKLLDGKAVTSYSKLVGIYERNKIIYRIISVVSGAQYKYARVNIEIDRDALLKDLIIEEKDKTAASTYIMREFSHQCIRQITRCKCRKQTFKREHLSLIASAHVCCKAPLSK